ncbi:MAG: N-acetyltransferase [Bacteroidales bacterium]|jgi:predicted N-acetyltransferase YhbS|nr:N-acetyltransferase [Bacteroidales bacterium]
MIVIRKENKKDYPEVYKLNLQAFNQITEPELVDRHRESDRFIPELSLIAEIDNKICGHILFTKIYIQSEGINKESLALAPMAVLPDFQNQGIGKQLIKSGLEKAANIGFKSVVVIGHAEYYPKFGFKPALSFDITAPWEVPNDVFMALELQENALSDVHGLVNYAQAFMDL